MKKILALILAVMLIMAMAIPALAVTPKYEFPDLPEIPDISDDVAENIKIKIPADFWGRWFADHPLPIFKLPTEELKDRLKGAFN